MSDESVEDVTGDFGDADADIGGEAGGGRTRARDCLGADDYEAAGEAYALATYERLGSLPSLDAGEGLALAPLADLLRATLCHRVAGRDERATNCAGQGLLVAEDLRDAVLERDVLVGLAWEYVGDFRLLSGLYGVSEAYDRAQSTYADSDPANSAGWVREDAFEWNTAVVRLVTANAGTPVDDRTLHGGEDAYGTPRMLTSRITVKRECYPEAVETVVERGDLDPL